MDNEVFNELFDKRFEKSINNWVGASVAGSLTVTDYSVHGDFFRDIGDVIDLVDDHLDSTEDNLSIYFFYNLLGAIIEHALKANWLDQPDHWDRIAELFFNRANEFTSDSMTIKLESTDISHVRLLKIVEYIVYNIDKQSELYAPNEFTIAEKVQMIRSILIGLRTNRFIESSPLLTTMFSLLATDWRVLGGGFGNNMGGGSEPWSHG